MHSISETTARMLRLAAQHETGLFVVLNPEHAALIRNSGLTASTELDGKTVWHLTPAGVVARETLLAAAS